MAGYDTVVSNDVIQQTQQALEENGIQVTVVADRAAAAAAVLALLPKGAEVLTVTSKTLDEIGVREVINESGEYDAVYPKLAALWGDASKKREQRKLGAAPDYVVGSVHALTRDGRALIASNTGSQLPAYVYGAGTVIWVVGAQKITQNIDDAMQRLETHVVPLEDVRAQEAYGNKTNVSKLLLFNKEVVPGRVIVILVKEALGF